MLAATVLLGVVPLYGLLVANVQLQAAINGAGLVGRNVELVVGEGAITPELRGAANGLILPLGSINLAAIAQLDVTEYFVSDTLVLARVNARPLNPPGGDILQATFLAYDYAQAGPHISLLAGALPQPFPAGGRALPEALITQQLAQQRDVHLGDTLTASVNGPASRAVTVRVVGIWAPPPPGSEYWNGRGFAANPDDLPDQPYNYPVLIDPSAFFAALGAVPGLSMEQHYIYYTDATRISTANAGAVVANLARPRHAIDEARAELVGVEGPSGPTNILGIDTITGLDKAIPAVERQFALLTLPFYAVAAPVVGLALLFVATAGSLLAEVQAPALATLRSRGASGAQIAGGYAVQGLILGGLALVAGAWLTGALALMLAHAFVPAATLAAAGVTDAYLAALITPEAVVVPAAVGAGLAAAAIVLAAQRASRADVLAFRQAEGRDEAPPWWRRLQLDLGLAVLCAIGYVELNQLGGADVRLQLGQGTNSPLLLAAPDLLLLAGGLLLLRLFPFALRLGARVAARGRGAVVALALTLLARRTGGPRRLVLLLSLAVALGTSALLVDATLVRNAADRADYAAGADFRVVAGTSLAAGEDQSARTSLAALPGVAGVTPVFRGAADVLTQAPFQQTTILAVDADTWASVAGVTSWHTVSGGAPAPLDALMAGLRAHRWSGTLAPSGGAAPGDSAHPIWAVCSDAFAASLGLHVGDRFALGLPDAAAATTTFVVGALVDDFPTLYATRAPGGGLVVDLRDYAAVAGSPPLGPNEYWIRAASDPAHRAALAAVLDAAPGTSIGNLPVDRVLDRQAIDAGIAGNAIQAGMRGLLLVGALVAIVLAVLAGIVQARAELRRRLVQLAVLRTLGMSAGQLLGMALAEQAALFAFAMLGGAALGVLFAAATLPFLVFSDTTFDPATLGVPPYILTADPRALALLALALAGALGAALAVTAGTTRRLGLGRSLRLGED
jgi:putative ABC transport system permease protein